MNQAGPRLRALRRDYRNRSDRRSHGDTAYAVYVGVLVVAAIAFPWGRAVVIGLGSIPSLDALDGPEATRWIALAAGVLLALVAWIGRTVGPVLLTPFFVTLLAGTDLPRARTLVMPLARSFGVLVLMTSVTAGMLVGGLAYAHTLGGAPPVSAARILVIIGAAALYAVPAGVIWLLARVLQPGVSALVAPAILALVALSVTVPGLLALTPWGRLALTWPGSAVEPTSSVMALGGFAAVGLLVVPVLLNRLAGPRIAEDADQWRAFRDGAGTADLSSAAAGLRSGPTTGRRWRAVRGRSAWQRTLLSDLIASLRTPDRVVIGSLAVLTAGAMLGWAPSLPLGWMIGALAGGLAYLGLGVWCDGLRHAGRARGVPAIYGYSDRRLLWLHTTLPGLAALSGLIAAAIATTVSSAAGLPVAALGTLAMAVAARAYDSCKGPLPLELLSPMPTAGGDASGMMVALWQVDALVWCAVTGGVLTVLFT